MHLVMFDQAPSIVLETLRDDRDGLGVLHRAMRQEEALSEQI